MKAVLYEGFNMAPTVAVVPDPTPEPHGVVVKVEATGLCLSDWHGWKGDDPDIVLPHVPGHELAGTVEAVGSQVQNWKVGDRVTVPFVAGCGSCDQCNAGNQQICDAQFQPGFTHWGSFAEYVGIHYADGNLVSLPEEVAFSSAASLGCRFATAWRAVVDQGRVAPGEWVAVHGCGGVGLSAIMIAHALGAQVVAIDIDDKAIEAARNLGVQATLNPVFSANVGEDIKAMTDGGAHISIDAIGNPEVCYNSICSLRKQGRHVQIGLMDAENSNPRIPLAKVIADELKIIGTHGMQAWRYPEMIRMILADKLAPQDLVTRHISLEQSVSALMAMGEKKTHGITVIDQF